MLDRLVGLALVALSVPLGLVVLTDSPALAALQVVLGLLVLWELSAPPAPRAKPASKATAEMLAEGERSARRESQVLLELLDQAAHKA